jgi:uncharacterized protein (DUF1015 family)
MLMPPMAHIRPFRAIRYARRPELSLSEVIAPPYDVLDARQKSALQAKHPNNIVTIDLPHVPPKTVGPDSAYEQAAITFQSWVDSGVLIQDPRPALYPYTQSYEHNGRTFHRRGFFCLVRLSPFGDAVIPHEKTYKGPIEDRIKLMRATRLQLSPIFGLFNDPKNQVTSLLYNHLGRPELSATLDGVKNDLWSVPDAEVENKVIDLLGHKPIYIADGHHRYTTALQYQFEELERNGELSESHPANWCLFSLVSMQDDGLLIHPTHRLVGGLKNYSAERFIQAVCEQFDVTEEIRGADHVAEFARNVMPRLPAHTFGLFDGKTRKLYQMRLKNPDIVRALEPSHSETWCRLDVAILQRYLVDEVIQPKFADGKEPVKGYTADPDEITAQVDGERYQIALLLQATPLHALEDLGKRGEVMPQKSTYFYPKLATGMVINPLM